MSVCLYACICTYWCVVLIEAGRGSGNLVNETAITKSQIVK